MRLSDVMHRGVATVKPTDGLGLAVQVMAWSEVRHLPVLRVVHHTGGYDRPGAWDADARRDLAELAVADAVLGCEELLEALEDAGLDRRRAVRRLCRGGLGDHPGAARLGPLDESVIHARVLPTDLDLNLHLNNGRALTLMDLGRVDLMLRMGVVGELRRALGPEGVRVPNGFATTADAYLAPRLAAYLGKLAERIDESVRRSVRVAARARRPPRRSSPCRRPVSLPTIGSPARRHPGGCATRAPCHRVSSSARRTPPRRGRSRIRRSG